MYKLKKNNKDYKKSVIEKQDVIEFTIEDADRKQEQYKTYEREWDAQIRVCKATIYNVIRNHPMVEKMSEVERTAVKMYLDNKEILEQYEPKLKELKKVMKAYVAERKEILNTFGWE